MFYAFHDDRPEEIIKLKMKVLKKKEKDRVLIGINYLKI
jgi:hypothetical protein